MDEGFSCPDCGRVSLRDVEAEREFTFGSKKPVTIKVTAPILICVNDQCKCEVHDWRMEKAKSLAWSAYLKEYHKGHIEPPEDLRVGHAASARHKKQLEHEGKCGCFYCLRMFNLDRIEDWIDDGETALCPYCGIDSVVPLTDNVTEEFLKKMQQFWFDAAATV